MSTAPPIQAAPMIHVDDDESLDQEGRERRRPSDHLRARAPADWGSLAEQLRNPPA